MTSPLKLKTSTNDHDLYIYIYMGSLLISVNLGILYVMVILWYTLDSYLNKILNELKKLCIRQYHAWDNDYVGIFYFQLL